MALRHRAVGDVSAAQSEWIFTSIKFGGQVDAASKLIEFSGVFYPPKEDYYETEISPDWFGGVRRPWFNGRNRLGHAERIADGKPSIQRRSGSLRL
jgi:hypothetical protein